MKIHTSSLLLIGLLAIELAQCDAVNEVLKLFDLDFDEVVVEKGENWVERYYIKQLKKCDIKMPDGYTVDMKSLARNAPPDYTFVDPVGHKYFFNVCRNTLMTCNGRDDGIAI